MTVADGGSIGATTRRGRAYADILARHGLTELTAGGASDPEELGHGAVRRRSRRSSSRSASTPTSALIRVARIVSVVDGGRILNEKLARSQIIGGTVGGIGQAIFEETITDAGTGRIANATSATTSCPSTPTCPTSTSCSSVSPTA